MYKKISFFLLIFALIMNPVWAHAIQTPLTSAPRTTVTIMEDADINHISYNAYLRIRQGYTSYHTIMVIENNNAESDTTIFMGIPAHIDDNTRKINDLSVVMDGKKQTIVNRRDSTLPDATTIKDIPSNWLAWTITLKPKEKKVIDCTFTIDNIKESNGTEIIVLPLDYLKSWKGPVKNIQVVADMDFLPVYVLEPNPSITPISYHEAGQLTWRFSNINTPQDIRLYFRPIDTIALNYIKANAPDEKVIDSIINSFRNKHYEIVIDTIDDFIQENPYFLLMNELLFIKALSHQALYQIDETINIYHQIEEYPGFGPMKNTIQNKIVYDMISYLKDNIKEDDYTLYQYLNEVKPNLKGNDIFLDWATRELSILQPPPTPEPPVLEPELPPIEEEPVKDERLVKDVVIAGFTIPVEIFFIAPAIIVIIILFQYIRKRKNKNRRYLFR